MIVRVFSDSNCWVSDGVGAEGLLLADTVEHFTVHEQLCIRPGTRPALWPDPDADVIARILDGPDILPRDAFEAGYMKGYDAARSGRFAEPAASWEHYQAERMKAAASTEPCDD